MTSKLRFAFLLILYKNAQIRERTRLYYTHVDILGTKFSLCTQECRIYKALMLSTCSLQFQTPMMIILKRDFGVLPMETYANCESKVPLVDPMVKMTPY